MICLLAATPQESALLRQQLPLLPDPCIPSRTYTCNFQNEEISLLHTGIGIASAASNLTRLLEKITPELILAFGCGGSYPASNLKNGDLAIATSECFGDLGAASDQGFMPLCNMGLPACQPPLFVQSINLETAGQKEALHILQHAPELSDRRIQAGAFVTVNTVSGTAELSLQWENNYSGICENMEGAALAQVAREYAVPLLELRGISNPCGTRDKAQWSLSLGIESAQMGVLRLLKEITRLRGQRCA